MSGNFLSCFSGVKDPFEAQEGRWDFFQDTTVEKGLISCGDTQVSSPLELDKQCQSFCRFDIVMAISHRATGQSHLASCLESILRVTVESVQGSQVYLEWIEILGTFGIVT